MVMDLSWGHLLLHLVGRDFVHDISLMLFDIRDSLPMVNVGLNGGVHQSVRLHKLIPFDMLPYSPLHLPMHNVHDLICSTLLRSQGQFPPLSKRQLRLGYVVPTVNTQPRDSIGRFYYQVLLQGLEYNNQQRLDILSLRQQYFLIPLTVRLQRH
jgi:hypothetical protein